MGRLGGAVLSAMPVLSTDEVIERIDAVALEDLRELAASCSRPSGCRSPGSGRRRALRARDRALGAPRRERGRRVIRVAVAGAAGRMGETVCRAVEGAEDMELSGRADPALGTPLAEVLPQAARCSSISPSRTRRWRTRSPRWAPASTS